MLSQKAAQHAMSSTTASTTITTNKPPPPRPLIRGNTLPAQLPNRAYPTDRLLAPEDAFYAGSPPRRLSSATSKLRVDKGPNDAAHVDILRPHVRGRFKPRSSRSGSRRRRGTWKKLLWVKQGYPDNYTDQATFLEHLQRNPRLQPYDFWPLVADSTVIVQHVCSVIIFVVCFVGIFQERVSPVAIVTCGSVATVLGWLLWDWWVGEEQKAAAAATAAASTSTHSAATTAQESQGETTLEDGSAAHSSASSVIANNENHKPLSATLTLPNGTHHAQAMGTFPRHAHSASASSIHSQSSVSSPTNHGPPHHTYPLFTSRVPSSTISPRNAQRLSTLKSAILIYFALLGLSPILKSLTKSTSSDSIWAISSWLMIINVFFFDYGSEISSAFPSSLSTNAALMASTVLASRLPSTEHVFSLTLFSIEVFGVFPVFRRLVKHISWQGHLVLTGGLVMGAGGGVGVVVSGGGWKAALVGAVGGSLAACLAMGGCSWWLIGLQKYKNEIHGPWDPARPVIRRQWDDD